MPPYSDPKDQLKPICVPVVIVGSFAKLIGTSGTLKILPVPPGSEGSDSSYELTAVTVAYTTEPQGRLNGSARRTVKGTLHD